MTSFSKHGAWCDHCDTLAFDTYSKAKETGMRQVATLITANESHHAVSIADGMDQHLMEQE